MFLGSCVYSNEYASLIGMTHHTHEREKQNRILKKKYSPMNPTLKPWKHILFIYFCSCWLDSSICAIVLVTASIRNLFCLAPRHRPMSMQQFWGTYLICCLLKRDVTSVVAVALSTCTLHSALEAVIVSFWSTRGMYNTEREAQATGTEDSSSCRNSEVVSWWTEPFSLPHSIWGQICKPVQRMGGVVRTDWKWKTKKWKWRELWRMKLLGPHSQRVPKIKFRVCKLCELGSPV